MKKFDSRALSQIGYLNYRKKSPSEYRVSEFLRRCSSLEFYIIESIRQFRELSTCSTIIHFRSEQLIVSACGTKHLLLNFFGIYPNFQSKIILFEDQNFKLVFSIRLKMMKDEWHFDFIAIRLLCCIGYARKLDSIFKN